MRPFKVEARGTVVTAVGTEFDVATGSGGVDVTLAHGAVLVSARRAEGARTMRLTPGDEVRIASDGDVQSRRVDLARAGAWRHGLIDLDHVTLAAALEEINRHSARRIEVEDAAALNKIVSGVFKVGDEAAVAEAVSGLFDETCARSAEEPVIRRRPNG